MRLKIASTLALLSIVTSSFALEQSTKLWGGIDFDGPFSKRSQWHYNFLSQMRLAMPGPTREQLVLRPSIYYVANDNWTLWLGCDAMPTWLDGRDQSVLERRIWPQIEFETPLNSLFNLDLRTRYEFRWRKDSSEQYQRFRQRIQLTKKLANHGAKLKISEEVLLNAKKADWSADETWDQNRLYIGFTVPLSKQFQIDCGYMNIFRPRENGSRVAHTVLFGLGVSFDTEPQPYLTGTA